MSFARLIGRNVSDKNAHHEGPHGGEDGCLKDTLYGCPPCEDHKHLKDTNSEVFVYED